MEPCNVMLSDTFNIEQRNSKKYFQVDNIEDRINGQVSTGNKGDSWNDFVMDNHTIPQESNKHHIDSKIIENNDIQGVHVGTGEVLHKTYESNNYQLKNCNENFTRNMINVKTLHSIKGARDCHVAIEKPVTVNISESYDKKVDNCCSSSSLDSDRASLDPIPSEEVHSTEKHLSSNKTKGKKRKLGGNLIEKVVQNLFKKQNTSDVEFEGQASTSQNDESMDHQEKDDEMERQTENRNIEETVKPKIKQSKEEDSAKNRKNDMFKDKCGDMREANFTGLKIKQEPIEKYSANSNNDIKSSQISGKFNVSTFSSSHKTVETNKDTIENKQTSELSRHSSDDVEKTVGKNNGIDLQIPTSHKANSELTEISANDKDNQLVLEPSSKIDDTESVPQLNSKQKTSSKTSPGMNFNIDDESFEQKVRDMVEDQIKKGIDPEEEDEGEEEDGESSSDYQGPPVKKEKDNESWRPKIRFTCDVCGHGFSQKEHYRVHMRIHTGDLPFYCDICHQSYRRKDYFKRHRLLHLEEKPFQCPACKKGFTKAVTFRNHLEGSHDDEPKDHQCVTCGAAFWHEYLLQLHSRVHADHPPYICQFCGHKFGQKQTWQIHERTHTGERPYKCGTCDQAFIRKDALKRHEMSHLGLKPFTCDVCNKGFTDSSCLRKHKKIHDDVKPFTCDYCGRGFVQNVALRNHIRLHTGETPFTCDICGKGFPIKHNMVVHRRQHTGERPFKCPVPECESTFACQNDLTNHKRTHSGFRPFVCGICSKNFGTSRHLKKHLIIHSDEKPHKCDLCGKGYNQKWTLKVHMRTHEAERQFKCDICKKDFRHETNLKRHLLTHTGEKPYSCPVCQQKFTQAEHLQAHSWKHLGIKPHKCEICGTGFNRKYHLQRHMIKHVNEDKRKARKLALAASKQNAESTPELDNIGEDISDSLIDVCDDPSYLEDDEELVTGQSTAVSEKSSTMKLNAKRPARNKKKTKDEETPKKDKKSVVKKKNKSQSLVRLVNKLGAGDFDSDAQTNEIDKGTPDNGNCGENDGSASNLNTTHIKLETGWEESVTNLDGEKEFGVDHEGGTDDDLEKYLSSEEEEEEAEEYTYTFDGDDLDKDEDSDATDIQESYRCEPCKLDFYSQEHLSYHQVKCKKR